MKALALAVALALAGCGGAQGAGKGAPVDLPLVAFDGTPVALHEYRGEIVVLHLFSIGSMAAQMDVAQLNAATKHAVVIGVALDPPASAVIVRAWGDAAGADYEVVYGGDAIAAGHSDLGALTVPTTVVLGRDGRVAFRVGRQLAPGELADALAGAGRGR